MSLRLKHKGGEESDVAVAVSGTTGYLSICDDFGDDMICLDREQAAQLASICADFSETGKLSEPRELVTWAKLLQLAKNTGTRCGIIINNVPKCLRDEEAYAWCNSAGGAPGYDFQDAADLHDVIRFLAAHDDRDPKKILAERCQDDPVAMQAIARL